MCSWGCELTSPCLRLCVCVDTTHSHTHTYIHTCIRTHIHTQPVYTWKLYHTASSTFSTFPGSPSLLFVYTVPLGWLDNVQGQPLQPGLPPPPFYSISLRRLHRAANHSAANVLSVLLPPFAIAARENAAKERKRKGGWRWNELIDGENRKRNTRGARAYGILCM